MLPCYFFPKKVTKKSKRANNPTPQSPSHARFISDAPLRGDFIFAHKIIGQYM